MKSSFMFMMGACMGVGTYIGLSNISKNKNQIKKVVNNTIDDVAGLVK